MMSEKDLFKPWSDCEGDIEKIDTSLQLVSSSSSSRSQSSLNLNQKEQKNEPSTEKVNQEATSISKSCDDLLHGNEEKDSTFIRSQSCQSLESNHQSLKKGKYDHIQSKIKQYIQVLNDVTPNEKSKISSPTTTLKSSKEEYLEEINQRLSRELEEKNAILLQLQENYEHLLLKYAEAQNKIDNLRLKTSNNSEYSNRSQPKSSFRLNILAPPVYPFKVKEILDDGHTKGFGKEVFVEGEIKVDRPTTLAVDSGLRIFDKDGLKVVTPTDSEGVSSVITSMSGHSKILTNLDDGPNEQEKKVALKSEVLESNLSINDPIDKVKNWQNSLPPLEFIETPETALYDMDILDPMTTPSTRYNEITELAKIPESSENWSASNSKTVSQAIMKKYLRTLSLPSSLTRRNMLAQIYKRRNNHTIDLSTPLHVDCPTPRTEGAPTVDPSSPNVVEVPTPNIIQRRKKRPPFLRSTSLPIYDYDSPRSGARSNVPPLDLDNLTFSEDDTSPVSKSNAVTTPSFLNSHEYSFQTINSLNSCKATASDYSSSSVCRPIKPVIHKSTSITPDRSKNMIFFESPDVFPVGDALYCNICGESVVSVKSVSYQGIHVKSQEWSSSLKNKSLVHRSLSFNSENSSPTHCLHNKHNCEFDSVESFEAYARDLKTRSQVIMKALTAHVHNS